MTAKAGRQSANLNPGLRRSAAAQARSRSTRKVDFTPIVERNRVAPKMEGQLLECKLQGVIFSKEVEIPRWVEWDAAAAIVRLWAATRTGPPKESLDLYTLVDVYLNSNQAMIHLLFAGGRSLWLKAADDGVFSKWEALLKLYTPDGAAGQDSAGLEPAGVRGSELLDASDPVVATRGSVQSGIVTQDPPGYAASDPARIQIDIRTQAAADLAKDGSAPASFDVEKLRLQVLEEAERCAHPAGLREALLVLQASARILAEEAAMNRAGKRLSGS